MVGSDSHVFRVITAFVAEGGGEWVIITGFATPWYGLAYVSYPLFERFLGRQ